MEYFNQYTYAEISANMISEIAYTETMTFWSTLISAPLVFFGSWAVKGTELAMMQASVTSVKAFLVQGITGMILSPIMEVFQEIIEDGFIEALSEGLVDLVGLPEDLGFWLSSFLTSRRELSGALGQLSGQGRQTALSGMFSFTQAIASGDTMSYLENLDLQIAQQQADAKVEQEQKGFWGKMLKTDLLKGIFMMMPSLFFGTFSFFALYGLTKITTSAVKLTPAAYTAFASRQHRRRKDATIEAVGTEGVNSVNNIFVDATKKPSNLDSVKPEIEGNFENSLPSTSNYVSTNPNPRIESRDVIGDKFFEGRFNEWIDDYILNDDRFMAFKTEFKQIQKNYEKIGFQKVEKEAIEIIKEALKEDKVNLRFFNMFGVEFYDPNYIVVGKFGPASLSEGSREWEQDVIETSFTTLDKMTEIKRYFDISGDYDMYLDDNGQKISIPVDDETKLAQWLQDRLYSTDSKIYVVPSSMKVEEFHTFDNWQDHPTYMFYQDMKALLTNRDPNEVTNIELGRLLGQSRSLFPTADNHLKDGLNYFYGDNILYKWLYNIDENQQLAESKKTSFKELISNYRRDNGLTYQDTHIDTLIGELRVAIQYEPDFVTKQGPSNRKLDDFFGLRIGSEVFEGDFRTDSILKLIYGIYRKSSDKFVLSNLGKSRISDDKNIDLAARKAMLSISKYINSKNFLTNQELKPFQKLVVLLSWYSSDFVPESGYINLESLSTLSNIPARSLNSFISGKNTQTRLLEVINNLEELVEVMSLTLRKDQRELLREAYHEFYRENERVFPTLHGIKAVSPFAKDWFYPQVQAKHIVELCLRQAGLLPAGERGELAEDFNIEDPKNRHHIDFNQLSKDVKNLILLGKLHSKFTRLEKAGDVDYKNLMQGFRDDFEAARPLSVWNSKLQDEYIERLIEFVIEWESTRSSIRFTNSKGEKVDFIKIVYRKRIYNIKGMLEKGWITEKWVDNIIQDIRQKLESRDLM